MVGINSVNSKLLKFLNSEKGNSYIKSNPQFRAIYDAANSKNPTISLQNLSQEQQQQLLSAVSELKSDLSENGEISEEEYNSFMSGLEEKLSPDTSTSSENQAIDPSSDLSSQPSVHKKTTPYLAGNQKPHETIDKYNSKEDDDEVKDERVKRAKKKMEDSKEKYDIENETSKMETENSKEQIADFKSKTEQSQQNIEQHRIKITILQGEIKKLNAQVQRLYASLSALGHSDDPREQSLIEARRRQIKAQIARLKAEIQRKQSEIYQLEDKIKAENSNIQSYAVHIDELNAEIEEIKQNVKNLKTTYEQDKLSYETILAQVKQEQEEKKEELNFNPKTSSQDKDKINNSVEDRLSDLGADVTGLSVVQNSDGTITAQNEGVNSNNKYIFDDNGKLISYQTTAGKFYQDGDKIYFEYQDASQNTVKDEIFANSIESIVSTTSNTKVNFDIQQLLALEKNDAKDKKR